MHIKKFKQSIPSSEITPKEIFLKRREFMTGALAFGAAAGLPSISMANENPIITPDWMQQKLMKSKGTTIKTEETLTPYNDVTSYNNFYEFGTGKNDPQRNSKEFNPFPWQVEIGGLAQNTGLFDLEDLIKPHQIEERVYRLRCVEAWSMVIPWMGFSLAELIKKANPDSKAKYVEFVTLEDKKRFPGQKDIFSTIDWPYREGLRIDEATHPLAFMAVGLYGEALPAQNGAPLRLVVPWKYGFKSIKSIVKINFVEKQPKTTWQMTNPKEYGFYSNVNPEVDHPRWSQKTERRLPNTLFSSNRIDTKMFNGYPEVADLYKGMDLRKFY